MPIGNVDKPQPRDGSSDIRTSRVLAALASLTSIVVAFTTAGFALYQAGKSDSNLRDIEVLRDNVTAQGTRDTNLTTKDVAYINKVTSEKVAGVQKEASKATNVSEEVRNALTNRVASENKNKDVDLALVQMAVSVLRESPSDDTDQNERLSRMKEWAARLINAKLREPGTKLSSIEMRAFTDFGNPLNFTRKEFDGALKDQKSREALGSNLDNFLTRQSLIDYKTPDDAANAVSDQVAVAERDGKYWLDLPVANVTASYTNGSRVKTAKVSSFEVEITRNQQLLAYYYDAVISRIHVVLTVDRSPLTLALDFNDERLPFNPEDDKLSSYKNSLRNRPPTVRLNGVLRETVYTLYPRWELKQDRNTDLRGTSYIVDPVFFTGMHLRAAIALSELDCTFTGQDSRGFYALSFQWQKTGSSEATLRR